MQKLTSWVALILGFILLYQGMGYVSLATGQQNVRGKTAEVWNQIDRASQLLDRLGQQLNATIELQKELIDKIAAARSAVGTASKGDTSDPNNISQALQAMIDVRVFNENYPNIGLNEIQKGVLDETAGSLNRITYARGELINAQTAYNKSRVLFLPIGLSWPNMSIVGEDQNPQATLPPSRVGTSPAP